MKTEVKSLNNSKIFYTFFLGFVLSIFLCSFVKLSFDLAIFLIIFAILIFIFIFNRFLVDSRKTIIILVIFLISFALGIIRYDLKESRDESQDKIVASLVGKKVVLMGTVSDEPNMTETSTKLTVKASLINDKNVKLKVLVLAGLFPKIQYGDRIQAEGKLEKPENFTSSATKEFDYVGYLAKDDIFYELSFANVQLISTSHGSFLKTKLFEFKNLFMARINSLIKEPESSLLGGLLLGAKNSLGKDWQNKFREAGVSHIVALSGYNITIVAEGIMFVLAFLPRMLSMSFGALGILAFAVLTGGSATVLRASVMALLVLLAKATGRIYDVVRALFVAAMFMLIQNPKVLVFDISFELSFLSTVALIFVSPILEKKFLFITEKYKLRELVLATISTQIFVLPFIFYKMGMISLVSLPANLLILPLIPIIMFFGFLTGMVALILPILAVPLALISSLLLSYVLKVINIFADLPFSALNIKNFPLILVVLIYLIFLIVIWRFQIVSRPQSNSN
jgi:competence protein ComEC